MTRVDVAVIGGGVTGLASALALARLGASVCLLEREGNAFQSYVSYQYTEETTMQMTVMGSPMNVPMTMEIHAVNPNKLRIETKIGDITSSLMISDGNTAWMYLSFPR